MQNKSRTLADYTMLLVAYFVSLSSLCPNVV